jgi:hypothetical protein
MRDAAGQPVVSFMDFGRELFGNLRDVTVYGMPAEGGSGGPLPDVAVHLGVNDVERSQALWAFVLGSAGGASGGSMEPASATVAGRPVARYALGGVPLFVAADAHGLVLSPSQATLERALSAGQPKRSILDDPVFAADAARASQGHVLVALANPGRCISFASGMMGPAEAEHLAPFAELMQDTVVTFGLEHTDTRLALRARVSSLPDVSGLVSRALRGEGHGDLLAAQGRPTAASAPTGLRAEFERLNQEGDADAAAAVLEQISKAAAGDAFALNNLAWAVATEPQYAGRYPGLALDMALRANDLSGYGNWYYLDTLARIRFDAGELAEAVRLERMAVERAGADPRGEEARDALARYEAALEAVAARE